MRRLAFALVMLAGCAATSNSDVIEAPQNEAPKPPIASGVAPPDTDPVEPPPVVEHPGPEPDKPAVWVPGHWAWNIDRGAFLWVRGVWALKESTFEPPPPRAENPSSPPSPAMFWAPGAWMYRGKDFLWVGGHWEKSRPGFVFKAPGWIATGLTWRFVEPSWQKE
jgi:hypothetical protein